MSPDNFMQWFPRIFQVLGLWPPKRRASKILYYAAYIPTFAFFTLYLNISEMIQCYLDRSDFKQTLLNLGMICLHLIATVRIIHWHCVRRECKRMMRDLLGESFTFAEFCSITGIFKRRKAASEFPLARAKEIEELEAFRKAEIRFANRQSCALYFGVIFLVFSDICVSYISVRVINAQRGPSSKKILPYNTYFSFDSQKYYDIAWLYQFFSILFTMYQLAPIDVIVLSVMINLMSQLKIIQKALRTIDDLEGIAPQNVDFVRETKLVLCINEIQRLLRIARKLNSLFNDALLFHYAGLTVVLCNIIYLIPSVDSYFELFTFTTVAFVVIGDVFVMCWFAHSMMDEFSNLSSALYDTKWDSYKPNMRRMIAFAMMQAQEPIVLTFGRIFQVNLNFFNNFLKMSYSFYTLLQKTQEGN